MVKRRLPNSVYRCKGVVHVADAPEQRAVLQIVGRRTDVTLMDDWGDRARETRIVAIGVSDGIDQDHLKRLFDSCLHTQSETFAATA